MALTLTKPLLVCLVAILVGLVATTSKANAQNPPLRGVNVVINGQLFCSPNGTPLANTTINLVAGGITIGTTTTGPGGLLNATVSVSPNILNNLTTLRAVVLLPISTCPNLANATGTLVGTPILLNASLNNGVLSLIFQLFNLIRGSVGA